MTRFLAGCAVGAVLAGLSSNAAAQSFNGAYNVVAGGASIAQSPDGGPGVPASTTVLVLDTETVIDWTAIDTLGTGAIDFQAAGTTVTFFADPAFTDYTVLNRILPVDVALNPTNATVAFNGTVTALLVNNPGGRIWFYSPTGIIVGPTATFNVGSLILTTDDIGFVPTDIAVPGDTGSIYGAGGLVRFTGPAGSTGFVQVQPGAQLNATGASAYLALVAPRVVQGGTVQANGQVAYLAAEQVDMTINGGLFDFTLTVGTDDPQGVVHTGTTTGPASSSAADLQRISMVALPKNDALTMLLAGSIGYTPAASAANEGSSVVLAAGFETDDPTDVPLNRTANIEINNATFRNALKGYASDDVTIAPVAGTTSFLGSSSLFAADSITLAAEASEQIVGASDLRLGAGLPGAGGRILIQALGKGLISVAGTLVANASSGAAAYVAAPGNLDAAGGDIDVIVDGGTINAATFFADAGGIGLFGDARGGIGTGGTVDVTIGNGGSMTVGTLDLSAGARGGSSARNGGDGTAGTANLTLNSGSLTAANLVVGANAGGGSASATAGASAYQSGLGSGGTSLFTVNGGIANVTSLTVQASGFGGGGETPDATGTDLAAFAGNGVGGTATLRISGGALTTADTTIEANGGGADGMSHLGSGVAGDGGIGTAGSAALQSPAGAAGSFSAAALLIQASGQGGDGGAGGVSGTDGNGGAGVGFSVAADLADGAFAFGAVTLDATGNGGPGLFGGEGSGGKARFAVIDTAGPSGARSLDSLAIDTSGYGGGDGFGAGGTAASDAGDLAVIASVLDLGSALDFTGNLTLVSAGTRSAAGNGIAVSVSGAPLTVGGAITMTTTRDAAVAAVQTLRALGNIGVNSRAFAETGLMDTDGTLSVVGTKGVAAERLESGGTTLLQAIDGPIVVSTDLASAGAVTALGRSIDITSLGALNIADARATAGDLRIAAAGDLTSASAQATGAAKLTGGGAFVATGPVNGGAVTLTGNTGITAGSVISGGTTLLQSPAGTVSIGALTSAGVVTAQGRALDLHSPAGLTFADAQATAGPALIDVQGDLALAQGSATGALTLSSVAGAITATGPLAGGGNTSITAPLGVDLAGLTSGGTTLLRATGGPVRAGNLLSAGLVTARGRSVDIASTGALSFADLDATAGALSVATAGDLLLTTADATGALTLRSTGGAVTASGAINAGGNARVEGSTSVTLPVLNSGGTTQLQTGFTGTVAIASLVSAGAVSVIAGSVDIVGPGPLTFTTAQAGYNTMSIVAAGDLAFGSVSSGNALTLRSTGGSLTVAGDLQGGFPNLEAAGNILIGGELRGAGSIAVTAGGSFTVVGDAFGDDANVTAPGGIAMKSLRSGEITRLIADNGLIVVPELLAAGRVTARGLDVDIASSAGLVFDEATATAGDVTILTADALTAALVSASNLVDLRSTGADVHATDDVTGAAVRLRAGGGVQADANLVSAGALSVDAGGTFTLAGLARGTAIAVRSADVSLGAAAALGVRGQTQTVTLTNANPARTMFIGGAANPSGYSLDQGEAARLFADQTLAFVSTTAQGNITIGDLALRFGGAGNNIGTGGTLKVTSPATIAILGDVALTTTGAGDSFVIDPRLVQLDTDTGSIALLGAGGAALGRLAVTGNTVAIATGAVLGQLGAAPTATLDALLGQPGGVAQPVRAGSIALSVVDGLYIQNTGPSQLYQDRRGFEAAALDLTTASNASRIVINGQVLQPGGPASGLDTQQFVTINGAPAAAGGQFDPGSTINGCVIGGRCAAPPGATPPSDADLTSPLPPPGGPGSLFVAPLIELAATDPLIAPPLVDEPITGVGNDDLWHPRCGDADQGDACPEADSRP